MLPPSPYIFAVLIQKWETPWAKVSPWGVLDSGDQASSYSCETNGYPVVSHSVFRVSRKTLDKLPPLIPPGLTPGVPSAAAAASGRGVPLLPVSAGLREEPQARLLRDRTHHHEPPGGLQVMEPAGSRARV